MLPLQTDRRKIFISSVEVDEVGFARFGNTFNTDWTAWKNLWVFLPKSLKMKLLWNKKADESRLLRSRADSNRCTSFCRALPSHSATRPKIVARCRFQVTGCASLMTLTWLIVLVPSPHKLTPLSQFFYRIIYAIWNSIHIERCRYLSGRTAVQAFADPDASGLASRPRDPNSCKLQVSSCRLT